MSDHERKGGARRDRGGDDAPRGSTESSGHGSGDGCERAPAEAQAPRPGPGPTQAPAMGWGGPGMGPPPWAAAGYPPPGYPPPGFGPGPAPWGGYVPFAPFPPFAPPMAPPPPGPGPESHGAAGGAAPGGSEGGYGPPWAHAPNAGAGQGPFAGVPGLGPWLRDDFTRGLLVGAAAAYMVANPKLQQATISSLVKAWNAVQGGFSELRERFQDAEAELDGNGSSNPEDT